MICERCGNSMPDGSLTCDHCGTYLGKYSNSASQEGGIRSIRQGRVSSAAPTLPPRGGSMREYGDYDLSSVPVGDGSRAPRRKTAQPSYTMGSSRPDTRRGVPINNAYGRAPNVRHKHVRLHQVHRHNVNWMLIGLIVVVLLAAVGGGAALYMTKSESGQRATARRNALSATEDMFVLAAEARDPTVQDAREELLKTWSGVNPQAYWLSGQDYLDMGDVETAITCFRIGDVVDPENYDGLLLLANAYELNMQDDLAETVYLHLVNDVSPSRADAYTALIRMYQNQERRPEAADMMLRGYQNTDKESYRLEREDYIPEMPQTSLNAGRYAINELSGDVYLTSPQGYDIYYTTDSSAVLPQDGILSEDGSFVPTEGSVTLRAVCVSGDLVSDPLSVSYTFYYPSPPAPKCNLAPNTYNKQREISLRPGEFIDDTRTKAQKAEDEKHYRYFYTIDGSTPTEDSPVYDGTPIQMPSGRVTLRAICINQYDKMSSIMEVGYKFNFKPHPLDMYQEEDVFTGFVLNKTNIEDFQETFGSPQEEIDTTYLGLTGSAKHLNYPWGYAVFHLDGDWELVRIEMNKSIGSGPRGVGFGSTEEEITAVYKDFGQVRSPNGERGLYYAYPSVGKVHVLEDGSRMIEYTCATVKNEVWVLQYYMGANNRCQKIIHYYQP